MDLSHLSEKEKKLVRSWIIQSALFLIIYLPILFLIAGDWIWRWGWVFYILLALFLSAHPLLLIPINPQLLAERARGTQTEGTKHWDRVLTMVGVGLLPFGSQLIGALDHRFSWTINLPVKHQIIGAIVTSIGYVIFLWAMVSNAFFTEGVRIQTERGHTVCEAGPYKFVRHPGYVGSILSILGTPFILGSYWALIPAVAGSVAIFIRTALEDRTLQIELEGYTLYAARVKYKLIPGIF
ncbi:MAG: isoprenylcysteine carboxylmethyltransferase family protein [Pelolinea sp.]|nr:isoprenylcysteine carboxylmethyltransferase family protein [Pelolinea sp.]